MSFSNERGCSSGGERFFRKEEVGGSSPPSSILKTFKKLSYILLIKSNKDLKLKIGKLEEVLLKKGYYVYVGSAPLNKIFKRIQRHFLKVKKKFWHIDFITTLKDTEIEKVWISEKKECEVSKEFLEKLNLKVVKEKLGASDCKCKTHFLRIDKKEVLLEFINKMDFLRIF